MTCKDCYHYDVCHIRINSIDFLPVIKGKVSISSIMYKECDDVEKHCLHFKDKLRIVKLPCFFGDKVYFPYTGENYPQKLVLLKLNAVNVGEVVRFTTDGYGTHIRVQFRENGCTELTFYADEINKKVFFDKEKAETKLKELNGNGRY